MTDRITGQRPTKHAQSRGSRKGCSLGTLGGVTVFKSRDLSGANLRRAKVNSRFLRPEGKIYPWLRR